MSSSDSDASRASPIRRLFRGIWTGVVVLLRTIIVLNIVLVLVALWFLYSGPGQVTVEDNVALVIAPSGALVDRLDVDPTRALLDEFAGAPPPQTALRDVITALDRAAEDPRITFVLLKLDEMRGAGLAQLAELNAAVQRFKTSGKTVVAYAPSYDQASYLAASHADEVVMDPMGALLIEGLSSYGNYVKGLTDKLGITMNVFRVGEYKSAVEPFLRTDMSDEARAANRAWLEDLWRRYGIHVGEGRGLDADATHQYVEALPQRMADENGGWAEIALDAGLVTHVETLAEFRDRMRVDVGTDPEHGSFRQVHFQRYLAATDEPAHSALRVGGAEPAAIARVVVQGDIVNGRSDIGLSGGDTVSRLLNDAQRDERVRAVLLRVDSPGGSVWASEQIRRAVTELQAAGKPVVVSMGNLAASGGYWISMNADRIFAQPETITGSIGIFGLLPTFEQTLDNIGVTSDGVGTTSLAGAFRLDRPLSAPVRQLIQAEVERGYDTFIEKVAEARGQDPAEIEVVARGRVWSGEDALPIGLIDAHGTEDDARAALVELAELDNWEVIEWTEDADPLRRLLKQLRGGMAGWAVHAVIPEWLQSWLPIASPLAPASLWRRLDDPRGQYAHCECGVGTSARLP